METFSSFFRSSVPHYFQNLPLPSSISEFGKLSFRDIVHLIPFFASIGLVSYVTYKELNDCLNSRKFQWVNKDYCKENKKIADIISKNEINEALDKNDKVSYCRCWKSKKFPYCDGAHNKHNEETGDNVGPVVFKK